MSDAGAGAGPAILARGLTKHFGSILALDALDLQVPAGSVFGLLGPNGAGKTTTIRILVGLARATSGTATVAGVPVGLDGARLHRKVGYLDQDPRFYSWMTGRELLQLTGRLHGLDAGALRSRVGETLEQVGLLAAGDRRIGGYSGGMRQRLGIGQAVLARPDILILDEPVTALDPEGRRNLLELVRAMRGTTTVVFSSHILGDVERICDRVAILDRGRLIADAPLRELLAEHVRPSYRLVAAPGQDERMTALAEHLAAASWVELTQADGDTLRVSVSASDQTTAEHSILPAVVADGVVLQSFERSVPTLEDVFLELVEPPGADELDGRGFVRPRQVRGAVPERRAPTVVAEREPITSGFRTLLRSELLEQWRTLKLPLTTAVFALLGFGSPLLARFTPEILKAVGTGPIQITLPTPTAADAVAQLLKNLGQFGALAAVVLAMGAVASEKDRGTAAFVLSKPVSRVAFLAAKMAAIASTLGLATVVAVLAAWFYTLVLFTQLPIGGTAGLAALEWLQLVAFAAITFLASTLTSSAVAAAGMAIVAFIILGVVGILPNVSPYLPTSLGAPAEALALGAPADPLIGPIAATLGLIAGMLALAWVAFARQEL
jgi:ABC-2 type transport system ATP-binding protein